MSSLLLYSSSSAESSSAKSEKRFSRFHFSSLYTTTKGYRCVGFRV